MASGAGAGSLLVKLGLDATEYFGGLTKAEQAAQRFAQATARSSRINISGGAADSVARSFSDASKAATAFGSNVSRSMGVASDSLKSLEGTARSVKATLGGVIAAFGAREIVLAADAWTTLNARMRIVAPGANDLNIVMGETFRIAQETRQPFKQTGDLYFRLAQATQRLGIDQSRTLKITDALSKSLIVSGSSGVAAEAAMIQFAQGLQSGRFSGQEFNSVNEQANRVLVAIAEGLGKTTDQIRALAEAGELKPLTIFGAIESQIDKINSEFALIPDTIAGAFTRVQNEFVKFVGTTGQASGAISALVNTLQFLSKNLDVLAAIGLGLVTAKLASVFINMSIAAKATVAGVVAQNVAHIAQVAVLKSVEVETIAVGAAQVGAAAANVRGTQAKIADLVATRAAIVAAREQVLAELALAQAFTARTGAQLHNVAAVTALATLGRQQAAINAQIVSSTSALALAQAGQAVANAKAVATTTAAAGALASMGAAAGTAGRLLLAFVGGPIGAVLTVLGLGATAWALWGSSSKDANDLAADSTKRSTKDILADLKRQNDALESRIALLRAGNRELATASFAAEAGEIVQKIAKVQADIRSGVNTAAGTDALNKQLIELQSTLKGFSDEARRGEKATKTLLNIDQQGNLEKFMKDNATATEKFNAELKETKERLGDLFGPEQERRLRLKFFPPKSGGGGPRLREDDVSKAVEAFRTSQIAVPFGLDQKTVDLFHQVTKASNGYNLTQEERLNWLRKIISEDSNFSKVENDRLRIEKELLAVQNKALEGSEDMLRKAQEEAGAIGLVGDALIDYQTELQKTELLRNLRKDRSRILETVPPQLDKEVLAQSIEKLGAAKALKLPPVMIKVELDQAAANDARAEIDAVTAGLAPIKASVDAVEIKALRSELTGATSQVNAPDWTIELEVDKSALVAARRDVSQLSADLATLGTTRKDLASAANAANLEDPAVTAAKVAANTAEAGAVKKFGRQRELVNEAKKASRELVEGYVSEFGALGKVGLELQNYNIELAKQNALKDVASEKDRKFISDQFEIAKTIVAGLDAQKRKLEEIISVQDTFRSSFIDNVSAVANGTKSIKEAVKGMADDILKQLNNIASKRISDFLFGEQGSAGGGFFDISKLFGGLLGGSGTDAKKEQDNTAASLAAMLAAVTKSGGGLTALSAEAALATATITTTIPPLTLLATNAGLAASALATVAATSASSGAGDVFGSLFGGSGSDPFGIGGWAHGGRMAANEPGWVGERGPEVFIPKVAGTIVPNNQLAKVGGTTTNNVRVEVNVPGSTNRQSATQIATEVGIKVQRALARNT